MTQEEDGAFIVRDGRKVGASYNKVSAPIFGPDGRSLAFEARSETGHWSLIKDGVQVGGPYEGHAELRTSKDGTRLIYIGLRGNGVYRVQSGW
jgi:hypothetical protein